MGAAGAQCYPRQYSHSEREIGAAFPLASQPVGHDLPFQNIHTFNSKYLHHNSSKITLTEHQQTNFIVWGEVTAGGTALAEMKED